MPHITHKEFSRRGWGLSDDKKPTLDQLQFGAIQRIADATEVMATNHAQLISERDRYEKRYREEKEANRRMANQIRALKGVITRMKKKFNPQF